MQESSRGLVEPPHGFINPRAVFPSEGTRGAVTRRGVRGRVRRKASSQHRAREEGPQQHRALVAWHHLAPTSLL